MSQKSLKYGIIYNREGKGFSVETYRQLQYENNDTKEQKRKHKFRAIIYCRGTKLNPKGLLKQEEYCRRWIQELKSLDITIIKTFSESKKTSPIHRSIFQEMIKYSRDNEINMWVVDKLKRLIKNERHESSIVFKTLKENDILLLPIELIEG